MKLPLNHGLTMRIDANDHANLSGWSFYPQKHRNVWYVLACKWDSVSKKQIKQPLHRLIMNAPRRVMVCHLNGNGLDCRRKNLALGSHHENGTSFRTKRKNAASRYRGVHVNNGRGKKWTVMFWHQGKATYLGRYENELEAAKVYDSEAKRRYGKFAHLNFP